MKADIGASAASSTLGSWPPLDRSQIVHGVGRTAPAGNGLYQPLNPPCRRCGAARHSGLSLHTQNRVKVELTVCGTKRTLDWPK